MICSNGEQPNQTLKQKKRFEEMRNIFNSMANEISDLKNTNSHREEYIKCLDKGEGLAYKGKTFFETKNKHRTLNAFLTRADRAIWFSKAFGLELDSLKITEAENGKPTKFILFQI